MLQAALDILPGDTPESLATRLLDCEHVMYPAPSAGLWKTVCRVRDGVVQVQPAEPQWLLALSAPAAGISQ